MADHSDVFTLTEALSQLAMKASERQLAAIKSRRAVDTIGNILLERSCDFNADIKVAAIHSITKMLDQISTCDCWQSLLIQLPQDLILPETPAEVYTAWLQCLTQLQEQHRLPASVVGSLLAWMGETITDEEASDNVQVTLLTRLHSVTSALGHDAVKAAYLPGAYAMASSSNGKMRTLGFCMLACADAVLKQVELHRYCARTGIHMLVTIETVPEALQMLRWLACAVGVNFVTKHVLGPLYAVFTDTLAQSEIRAKALKCLIAALSWPHLPSKHLKNKLLRHMSAVLLDDESRWRLAELACGFAATYHILLAKVVEVYTGTPHIEEYLQAYSRLARVKGEDVSRVCAFHCSKVVKAAGPHHYMPHIHSAVQALARHNKMEVRVAIAKQMPQMAQVLDQETCQDFLARIFLRLLNNDSQSVQSEAVASLGPALKYLQNKEGLDDTLATQLMAGLEKASCHWANCHIVMTALPGFIAALRPDQVGVLFESLMATIVRGAGQESKHVRQAAAQAAVAVMQHSHDLQVQAATCQRVAVAHADQVTNMCAVLGMFQLIIAGNDMRSFWPYIHDACKGLSQDCSNPEVRRQAQLILSTMRELNSVTSDGSTGIAPVQIKGQAGQTLPAGGPVQELTQQTGEAGVMGRVDVDSEGDLNMMPASCCQGVRPAATWHAATATGGQHERRHDTASCQVVPAAALHSESQPPGSTLIPKTQQSLGLVGAALLQKPVTMPAMAPQSLWDTVMPAHDLVTSSDEEGDAQPEGDLEVVDMLMSLAAGKAVRPKQASSSPTVKAADTKRVNTKGQKRHGRASSKGDRAVAGRTLASDRQLGTAAAGPARQSKHKAQIRRPHKHKQNGAHAGPHDSFQLLCHAIEAGGDMSPQVPEAVAQNEAMKELVAQGDPDPVRYILPARLVCCDGDMSVTDFLHLWEDDVEFGNQLFPVEDIAAERRAVTETKSRRKAMQYLVKYKGYTMNPNGWLDASHLQECEALSRWEVSGRAAFHANQTGGTIN